jgi:hypothetical protein
MDEGLRSQTQLKKPIFKFAKLLATNIRMSNPGTAMGLFPANAINKNKLHKAYSLLE